MDQLLLDDDPSLRECRLCHRKGGTKPVIPCGEDGIPICSRCAERTPDFSDNWINAASVLGVAQRTIEAAIKHMKGE